MCYTKAVIIEAMMHGKFCDESEYGGKHMNPYIGHENQIFGVEEVRLVGTKGDGLRLLLVRNGQGLEFTVSADRCADIARLSVGGVNFGYFSPCGWVAPSHYDKDGLGFLKSFTAGFLTTCGLTNAGSPCVDGGEALPQHGTIGNTPAENIYYYIESNEIHIKATVRDAIIFGYKLMLEREYTVPLDRNELYITDKVSNIGSVPSPLMMLYHFNVGYPLLTEDAEVLIPSKAVNGADARAEADKANCLNMEKPQAGYEEMCFFHKLEGKAEISVNNPRIGKGFTMSYDTAELSQFCEWKMMGEHDYVLGVEPGTTTPIGRVRARDKGMLITLNPGESKTNHIKFEFVG